MWGCVLIFIGNLPSSGKICFGQNFFQHFSSLYWMTVWRWGYLWADLFRGPFFWDFFSGMSLLFTCSILLFFYLFTVLFLVVVGRSTDHENGYESSKYSHTDQCIGLMKAIMVDADCLWFDKRQPKYMPENCAPEVIFSHTAPVLYSYPLFMVHLNGSLVCFYLVASLWCQYYFDCEACRSICTLVGCSALVLINLWVGKTPVNIYMWPNFQRRWWYYWLQDVLNCWYLLNLCSCMR